MGSLTNHKLWFALVCVGSLFGQQRFTRNPKFDNTYEAVIEATINRADPALLRYHQNGLTGATAFAVVGAADMSDKNSTLETGGVYGVVRSHSSASSAVAGSFFSSAGTSGGAPFASTLAAPVSLTDTTITLTSTTGLLHIATYLTIDQGNGSYENIAVCDYSGSVVNICPNGRARYYTTAHTHAGGAAVSSGQRIFLWGLNALISDGDVVLGQNYDYVTMQNEWDFNVFNTKTQLIAHSIGGASQVQPASAIGYLVNSLGPGAKWDYGFGCFGGSVKDVCFSVNSMAFLTPDSNSQSIQFVSLDHSTHLKINKLFAGSTGNFFLTTDGLFAITDNTGSGPLYATIGPNGIQIPRVISAAVHYMNLNTDSSGNGFIQLTDTLRISNFDDTTTYVTIGPSGISLPKVVSSIVHRNILVDDSSANLLLKLAGALAFQNEAGTTNYATIGPTGIESVRPFDSVNNPITWTVPGSNHIWSAGPFTSLDDGSKSDFVFAYNSGAFWRINQAGDFLPYLDQVWNIGSAAAAVKSVAVWTLTPPAAATFGAVDVAGQLNPSADDTYTLGVGAKRWKRVVLSGGITTEGSNFINAGSSVFFQAGSTLGAPNGANGMSSSISVRKGDDSAGCTITVSGGIVTGTTC